VEVGDAIARVRADVQHKARAALSQAFGRSNSSGGLEHLHEDITVAGIDTGGVDDVGFGDN